jgi:hypothetical protein
MALSTIDTSSISGLGYGFKNRIINGGMVIDQRNAGASITPTGNAQLLDRWQAYISVTSKFSVQQNAGSITPPVGFTNYLGVTSLSAYSVGASDYFYLRQAIEGFNFADMAWGTANAQPVTLSFRVYSSLTGTFGGALSNSASSRSYPFSYTVSAANTWTTVSVTIAGDTTGTWIGATNGVGLQVLFSLGTGTTYSGTAGSWAGSVYVSATGATSVVGTNGATFYITGVQLEAGTVATSFDWRPYGTELQLCQRYYYKTTPGAGISFQGAGVSFITNGVRFVIPCVVPMRASPSALEQSGTASDYGVLNNSAWTTCSAVPALATASSAAIAITFTVASGLTAGGGAVARAETVNGYFGWSAEL